jgi:hypothetical protein
VNPRRIRFHRWAGPADLDRGSHDGTAVRDGVLTIATPQGRRVYDDPHHDLPAETFEQATWTSPEVSPGFDLTELVASWNARTPPGTWLEVALQVTTPDGPSRWYVMGRWAETDQDIRPTSVPGQSDARADVRVDRLRLRDDARATSYRLRVTLLRRVGSTDTPSVSLLGCVASRLTDNGVGVTPPGPALGTVIDVPRYSQQVHLGEYPQWADGGEAWCSPTSTSMVLAHWGLGPSRSEYAWVDEGLSDRFVPYAARHTFDHAYDAPGNWSFNVAYAARFGTVAFVTRLRSLAEAERFVAAGIPLVVGVAFTRAELDGACYDTTGHLAVLVGFDERGDVVVNDPASQCAADNGAVRTTFGRAAFERAWMRMSGGITYVIHPTGVALPQPPAEPNW